MNPEYNRSATGTIEQIEILVLRDLVVMPCPDQYVAEIGELWQRIPTAEQKRCHVPPYGLRFYREGILFLKATLCWQCNNIHLTEWGESCYSTFDAHNADAQRLLEILKTIAADSPHEWHKERKLP